jgi:hypothetical protein
VAWALPCLYDTNTNRPLLGSANICPQALLRAEPDAAVSVLVHELTHALGFTDDMFDKFIDDSGQPIPKNKVCAWLRFVHRVWVCVQGGGGVRIGFCSTHDLWLRCVCPTPRATDTDTHTQTRTRTHTH